jgi:hypothetical protein
MIPRIRFTLFAITLCTATASSAHAAPAVHVRQGQYFRALVPAGWKVNETPNGVDMAAPDGSATVSFSLLIGGWGPMTPRQFTTQLAQMEKIPNFRILADRPMRIAAPNVKADVLDTSATVAGKGYRGRVLSVIQSGYGRFGALQILVAARSDRFAGIERWLERLAGSVAITNTAGIGMQDQVMLPPNRPLESVFGNVTENWAARNRVYDDISRKRSDATLGVETVYDPVTGEVFRVPNRNYDARYHGYHDPRNYRNILLPLPSRR